MDGSGSHLLGFDDPLRQLYLLAVEPDLSLDEKIARLLELGTQALGLELGIVSQVTHPIYRCLYVYGPGWAPAPGASFDISGTYCLHTLTNDGVTCFHHAGQQEIADHPCYLNFQLESYIGAPVVRGGEPFGTLNFSARGPRSAPFTASQRQFVEFLARWLSNELRLAAERRDLREQRTFLRAVIDAVPEAVVMTDPNRRIAMANPAVARIFGYAPQDLVGRQTAVLYEELGEYEARGAELYAQGPAAAGEDLTMRARRADGSTFEAAVSSASVFTSRDEHLGFLGVIRDVTEQRNYARAKDQLIATVSHEMKTPLTSLSGALRLLDTDQHGLSPGARKILAIAQRNADAIGQMVTDILDLESLRGQTPERFDRAPLLPLLTRAAEELTPYAAEREVRLEVQPGKTPAPLLQLHEGRILRLLANLLSNAIKASPAGGRVTLGPSREGTGFWIRDAGPGIPLALQPVLFERFSRATNYRLDEGTGLGMSIVKAIVDQHLGEIAFDTAENRGTTFRVTFPLPAGG
jgi:PAS domain S-box-containing protein